MKKLTEFAGLPGLRGCVVLAMMVAGSDGLAQQPAAPQKQPPMDPAMQMDPAIPMKPGAPAPSAAPKPQAAPHGGQSSTRPITEPTVPPADDAQEMPMHHHGPIAVVAPKLPQLGRSIHPEGGIVYQLRDLEQRAMTHNPALLQAQKKIAAAQGARVQSGLFPNPTIGYSGDELRGGSYKTGKQGFFVEQTLIPAGKLGLNRKVEDRGVEEMKALSAAQSYGVRNAVRVAYYRVLTAQELLYLKGDLAGIAHATTEYAHELGNTGQADETEILQREVAEQKMLAEIDVQRNELHRAWSQLLSVVGEVSLPMGTVQGDLESLPAEVDDAKLLGTLLAESPAVLYAKASLARAEAVLARAHRELIPDVVVKGGLQQDNEPLGTPQSRAGLVGFAEIGAEIHVFNRNQGNLDAAGAEVEAARAELLRVELLLRGRSATVTDDYRNARVQAVRYRAEILPRVQRAYVLMTRQYGLMGASFSRVLNLQRELYENEVRYVEALEAAQTNYVVLNGFLYSGDLDARGYAAYEQGVRGREGTEWMSMGEDSARTTGAGLPR